MLLEAEASQFVVSHLGGFRHRVTGYPLRCSIEGVGDIAGFEEVAHHFGALGYEESLAMAELLLLQLAYEFYLVFADHFQKRR